MDDRCGVHHDLQHAAQHDHKGARNVPLGKDRAVRRVRLNLRRHTLAKRASPKHRGLQNSVLWPKKAHRNERYIHALGR